VPFRKVLSRNCGKTSFIALAITGVEDTIVTNVTSRTRSADMTEDVSSYTVLSQSGSVRLVMRAGIFLALPMKASKHASHTHRRCTYTNTDQVIAANYEIMQLL
jgi:hypothetical protein